MKSLYEIETLSLYEYSMRMKAHRLTQIDREYELALQAWLNQQVQATKEQGSKQVPVYKEFRKFFDYEARVNEIDGVKSRLTPQMRIMAKIAARVNEGR